MSLKCGDELSPAGQLGLLDRRCEFSKFLPGMTRQAGASFPTSN